MSAGQFVAVEIPHAKMGPIMRKVPNINSSPILLVICAEGPHPSPATQEQSVSAAHVACVSFVPHCTA
jgi:hypothetical protein